MRRSVCQQIGACSLIIVSNLSHCDGNVDASEKIYGVSSRLKTKLDNNKSKKLQSRSERAALKEAGALNHCHVFSCEIKAPLSDVVGAWEAQSRRPEWDKSQCAQVEVIGKNEFLDAGSSQLIKVVGKSGYLIPARDYVYRLFKGTGGIVGCNDFTAVAFISIDASNEVPRSWFTVRGKLNSILLLQPSGKDKTKATYVVEFDYGGWVPSPIVGIFAENMVTRTLKAMKKEVEQEPEQVEKLSVDAEAKKIIANMEKERKEAEKMQSNSLASLKKEDIKSRVRIIEKQLWDIGNDHSMNEMRKELTSELEKAREKLKSM